MPVLPLEALARQAFQFDVDVLDGRGIERGERVGADIGVVGVPPPQDGSDEEYEDENAGQPGFHLIASVAAGDTYAKPEQHERQQDKEAECHGVKAVLRQRDHAIGRAARRQVHEHIVAKQPVDDAFAECAIAAVADIGVREEVAVADDHGALLALRGAG